MIQSQAGYVLDSVYSTFKESDDSDLFSGPYFPYARRGSGTARGELYEITPDILEQLDLLEGHPTFYRRELHAIRTAKTVYYGWIYLYQGKSVGKKIDTGEWKMF